MRISWHDLLGAALASVLASSCSTSPPGAGFTNGETAPLSAEEKPAVRDDLRMPTKPDSGDAPLAGSAASSPSADANDAGTGGRGAGQAGNPGAARETSETSGPSATPPKLETPAESGAQGGTRPPGNINDGTPRSPQ